MLSSTSRLVPLGKAGPPTTNSIRHQTWSCLPILCILMFYVFPSLPVTASATCPTFFVFIRNFGQPLLKFPAQLDRHSLEPRPENRRQGSLLSIILKAFKLLDLLTRPPWSRSWRSVERRYLQTIAAGVARRLKKCDASRARKDIDGLIGDTLICWLTLEWMADWLIDETRVSIRLRKKLVRLFLKIHTSTTLHLVPRLKSAKSSYDLKVT